MTTRFSSKCLGHDNRRQPISSREQPEHRSADRQLAAETVNPLVEFWRKYALDKPPYIHPEDRHALKDVERKYFDCSVDTFDFFVKGERFGDFENNKFFSALVPAPYMGRLDKADVVILMLNPGLEYVDYYAEYQMSGIKEMREKTFQQHLDDLEFPFCWLNPEYCWHSGFIYWEKSYEKS